MFLVAVLLLQQGPFMVVVIGPCHFRKGRGGRIGLLAGSNNPGSQRVCSADTSKRRQGSGQQGASNLGRPKGDKGLGIITAFWKNNRQQFVQKIFRPRNS